MLTRPLPRALLTASVTYHQIKAASEGWKTVRTPHIRQHWEGPYNRSGVWWMFSCSGLGVLSGPLFIMSQMFLPPCVWGRECAGWFSPGSADLLATLGRAIPVIAAKAARRPNECLRRKSGSHHMHIFTGQTQKQHKAFQRLSRLLKFTV